MRATFSPRFKEEMIRKMAAPGGPSANALAAEVGVAQSTLSRWLREAGKYRPTYPDRPFASIEEAREWVAHFVP